MAQKRKPKQGYVYLLKDANCENQTIYKFGCTTLTPEKRCKRVNIERADSGFNFKVICSFKSFDIYSDESNLKANLLNAGAGYLGEVFSTNLDPYINSEKDLIEKFLKVGGVLEKGVNL